MRPNDSTRVLLPKKRQGRQCKGMRVFGSCFCGPQERRPRWRPLRVHDFERVVGELDLRSNDYANAHTRAPGEARKERGALLH